MNEKQILSVLGALPPTPRIYRIVVKGKWLVPGGAL
jgi:hypothetical protein